MSEKWKKMEKLISPISPYLHFSKAKKTAFAAVCVAGIVLGSGGAVVLASTLA